ncbi:hypothetical protein [Streptomyces sp. NPDC056169]|uniref:hypothetical protein n=1 Tax=Streptomyces sp. NPDC056169 TaxID=3345734 RepID=UPI0035D990CE
MRPIQGELEGNSGLFTLDGSGAVPLEEGDPRQIGAFRLLGVLGSGGMGRVYLGAVPGKFAAVKRVPPVLAEDADFLSHFGHELDNLARLPAGANTKLLHEAPRERPDGQAAVVRDFYRVVHGEPDFGRLTEAGPELTALLRRCFAKDPADRPSAAELVKRAEERAAGASWPAAVTERIGERAAFASEAGCRTRPDAAGLRAGPVQQPTSAGSAPVFRLAGNRP